MSQISKEKLISETGYQNIFEAASDGLIIYDIKEGVVIEANLAACKMHGYSREEFIGLNPTVFMVPESYNLFMENRKSSKTGNLFEALAIHVQKDGSPFHIEIRRSMVRYQGKTCLLSVIRDVSERIEREKIQYEQMKARTREQATLLAISHILASTLAFQPRLILDQLHLIIDYNIAGLFSIEMSNLNALAMRGTELLEPSMPFSIPLNVPENLVSLFNGHRPIRIADIWSDEPQAIFLRSLLKNEANVLLEGMQSWMWVPFAVKSRLIGGIGMAHKQKNYFTHHHEGLALSVANQAAITMINVELYGQAQTLAVLEERQRLARNLHDAINQSLFSAGLIAEVLPRLWEKDQQEARDSLKDLRSLTRGAQAEMRALLAELRPSTLTDSNLGDLLELLSNAHSGRTNVPVSVTSTGDFILPADVQIAFYRICQEALYNVAKHTKANKVEIHLKQENNVIELCIRDNGAGFDPQENFSGHYGLSIMRERAEAIGAVLTILSEVGSGTELIMRWNQSTKETL